MAKKLLMNEDVLDVGISSKTGEIITVSSQEYAGNSKFLKYAEEDAQNRLKKIEKSIGLENVIKYLVPTDLIDICKYPNLGNLLASRLFKTRKNNGDLNYQNRITGEERKISEDEELPKNAKMFDWEEFTQTVKDNIKYIDIDKMLILSNAVFLNEYKHNYNNHSYEEINELREYTKKTEDLLKDKKLTFFSRKLRKGLRQKDISTYVEDSYKKFIGGQYYSIDELNDLIENIIIGKQDIETITPEEFSSKLELTSSEIAMMLIKRPSNIKYLIENQLISKEQLIEVLNVQGRFADEELIYLCNNEVVDSNLILELYNKKQISLENIKGLKKGLEKSEFLKDMVSSKKLVELYFDEEKSEEFNRYRKLFKVICIDDQTPEEQYDVSLDLLDQSLDLLEDEKILEFYHMGLVSIDALLDFIKSPKLLKDLYLKGELKPIDARRMYDTGKISKDTIQEVLASPEIDDGKKITLIYSTFPNLEDKQLRDELIKNMQKPEESIHQKSDRKTEKDSEKVDKNSLDNQTKNVSNKYDPCAKWNLITALDSEYTQKYLKDGYIVFYMPNQGKYIIEKLYNSAKKPAFGAATYILDENLFEEHEKNVLTEDKIIQNEKINVSVLRKLKSSKTKGIDKIVHVNWGEALCRYFEIDDSSKYSENQKNEIRKLAKEVELSKKKESLEER